MGRHSYIIGVASMLWFRLQLSILLPAAGILLRKSWRVYAAKRARDSRLFSVARRCRSRASVAVLPAELGTPHQAVQE